MYRYRASVPLVNMAKWIALKASILCSNKTTKVVNKFSTLFALLQFRRISLNLFHKFVRRDAKIIIEIVKKKCFNAFENRND